MQGGKSQVASIAAEILKLQAELDEWCRVTDQLDDGTARADGAPDVNALIDQTMGRLDFLRIRLSNAPTENISDVLQLVVLAQDGFGGVGIIEDDRRHELEIALKAQALKGAAAGLFRLGAEAPAWTHPFRLNEMGAMPSPVAA